MKIRVIADKAAQAFYLGKRYPHGKLPDNACGGWKVPNNAWFNTRKREEPRYNQHVKANSSIRYTSISLNYTNVLDVSIAKASKLYRPFSSHRYGQSGYDDAVDSPLHLHGLMLDGGDVVFGVNDESQVADGLSEDDDFCNLWVKYRKNYYEYGNLRTNAMQDRVASAGAICMFGVSLGKTDDYIWKQIGNDHLDSQACIVFYSHDLAGVQPGRRAFQTAKHKVEEHLRLALGWDEEQYEAAKDRVFIQPSTAVFKAKLKLKENEQFPDVSEG